MHRDQVSLHCMFNCLKSIFDNHVVGDTSGKQTGFTSATG